ncbi:hypothetical protein [Halalkalicoccus jeotgali]|uniref:Uncharacterized protein n=1 Tax=Halalkalicoccus jeotgali (strain DSM 18796 / CECT 7217 / JCM 14584 / KCTC 4019 / B3) TaxID=795797 RepID=D8J9X7_HALJB|nr:hypothetical protein [Halalkalicoccus jeotgali]ADJ14499.1 hypothetical protein HacjB3_05540 [Halalkalicoccus jeotgali B3]ELY40211.1 hypothetical protein C497_03905 [Halalkalicoccus jeotgali B3]
MTHTYSQEVTITFDADLFKRSVEQSLRDLEALRPLVSPVDLRRMRDELIDASIRDATTIDGGHRS